MTSEEDLTDRELEVASLAAQGLTVSESAEALAISENTVKTHLKDIYRKSGVRNRAELVLWLIEKGVITRTGD